jgi:cation diffusion facilitator CzcD-associated flavoprotein CzcO
LSTPERSRRIPVPQTDPRYGQRGTRKLVNSIHDDEGEGEEGDDSESLEFESPLYDYLETNIPKTMMAFSDKPFPEDAPLYPSHQQVLEYLEEYSEEVKPLIRFRCQVQDVSLDASSSANQPVWCIEVRDLVSNSTCSSKFDAVVVANGHYTVPSLPHIEGIDHWNAAHPGSILHSKSYRKPEEFRGKKVLIIGNSASGLDVAYQVGRECKQPVLLSSRSISAFGTMPGSSWRKDVCEVVEFLPVSKHSRAVRLKDGSIENDIDAVIFCTGYFYSYPFLSGHNLPIVGDGLRVRGTFEHLFHSTYPTLVFPVINLKVIPFPLAEHQAAVVARVWSGRLSLPSREKMQAWETSAVEHKGNGKYFHLQKFPETQLRSTNSSDGRNLPQKHRGWKMGDKEDWVTCGARNRCGCDPSFRNSKRPIYTEEKRGRESER